MLDELLDFIGFVRDLLGSGRLAKDLGDVG